MKVRKIPVLSSVLNQQAVAKKFIEDHQLLELTSSQLVAFWQLHNENLEKEKIKLIIK